MRPAMEGRRAQLYIALLVLDLMAVAGAFVVAGGVYSGRWPLPFALSMAYAFLPIFAIIALYQRCYSLRALDDLRYAVSRVGSALLVSALLCIVMIFYSKSANEFSRVIMSLALILGFVFTALLRVALHRFLRWSYGPSVTSVLIVQDGGPVVEVDGAEKVDLTGFDLEGAVSDPESLDRVGKLMRGKDRVVVSCSVDRRLHWARIMRAAGVRGDVISETLQELGALALVREKGQSFLVISTGPLSFYARFLKRLTDLALTIPALIVLSPVLLITALLIKLEDGGPVFFVQPRMGRGNCIFQMYKFRSMRVGQLDSAGATSTSRTDERITRIGKVIRSTSIDELPQLFNVLRSEMSIVGPRPHALGSLAETKLFWEIDENYWQRHSLKPGLTGLAQVRGHRGATELENHLVDRLNADLEYIRDWSLLGDLRIIVATAGVLLHPNAY